MCEYETRIISDLLVVTFWREFGGAIPLFAPGAGNPPYATVNNSYSAISHPLDKMFFTFLQDSHY